MISAQVKGLKEMRRTFEKILKERPGRVSNGLKKSAKKIFDPSQEEVPVARGVLQRSGKIGEVETDGTESKIEITYGDDQEVNYASYVHEIPRGDNRHKYLERPTMEYVKDFAKDMAKETGF